jgi:hypothetical protein
VIPGAHQAKVDVSRPGVRDLRQGNACRVPAFFQAHVGRTALSASTTPPDEQSVGQCSSIFLGTRAIEELERLQATRKAREEQLEKQGAKNTLGDTGALAEPENALGKDEAA